MNLPRIHVTTTPSGYAGTLKTVQHIIDLMREGAINLYRGYGRSVAILPSCHDRACLQRRVNDPHMQSICRTTNFRVAGSQGDCRNVSDGASDRTTDSPRRQGLLCQAESHRDIPCNGSAPERSFWRSVRPLRLGTPQCPVYARYFPGGAPTRCAAYARAPRRRL
jgi:hypothetical protein